MLTEAMNVERAAVAKRIEVMQAYVDGKQIQCCNYEDEVWVDCYFPAFHPGEQYRVSPVVKRTMYLSHGKPMRLFDPEVVSDSYGMTPVEVTFTIPEGYEPQY